MPTADVDTEPEDDTAAPRKTTGTPKTLTRTYAGYFVSNNIRSGNDLLTQLTFRTREQPEKLRICKLWRQKLKKPPRP